MHDLYQIERLGKLHLHILKKEVGSPIQIADKLNIGVRYFHRLKELLKEMGAEISYSKSRKTYFYTNSFDLHLLVDIHSIVDGEIKSIYHLWKEKDGGII